VNSKTENETALYDDPEFFAAYEDMRALEGTLNEIVETPALVSLMPKLQGITAADLGCGMGGMCHWLMAQGAASVVGFDSSLKMLARAKQQSPATENLRFEQAELDRIDLAESSFDLILSGLALHYAADFQKIAGRVSMALRPGGSFIFSVEHPIITCGERNWVLRDDGARAHWPVDHYLDEGSRKVNWLGFNEVPRYHRTISSYVNTLLDAGLVLQRLNEPGPSSDDMTNWPRLKDQRRRPPFLVIRADKPDHG